MPCTPRPGFDKMQTSEPPTFIWGSGTSSIMYVGEKALAFSWKSESSQPASFAKVDGMDLIRKGRLRGSGTYRDFLYHMKDRPTEPVTEIPDVPVALMKGYTNLQLFFSDRVGLIVTWPGAFMPGSKVSGVSASFLEDLDRLSGKIREKVDFLGLCVVNDPFVAQSWSRVEIANIDIVCDPECILTEHLGVAKVVEPLGLRANRAEAFLLGPEKQVRRLDIPFLSAEAIHECLLQKIITPWKSFVVADQPEDIIQELRANGYACEPNWQLHLTITDDRHSFLASHENLASGLTWLFDEIQKGDDVVLWIPAHLLSWVKADTFSRVPDSCRLNLVVHNPRRVPLDHGFNWIFDGVWSKHRVPGVHTRGEVSSIMVLGDFVPSLEEPLSDRCV